MKLKIIIAAVKSNKTDPILASAKDAGAKGATIIHARGTGIHEAKTFFGLTLEDQSDIIMILLEEHLVTPVLDAMKTTGEFHKPGTGIAFVLPVEQAIGLESQVKRL
jgi:nitrogen regulatory protein PII